MALCWGDELQGTVMVLMVIPPHKLMHLLAGLLQALTSHLLGPTRLLNQRGGVLGLAQHTIKARL